MTFATQYSVGDTIVVHGSAFKVVGIHIYYGSGGIMTERYYLGNGIWYTLERSRPFDINKIFTEGE